MMETDMRDKQCWQQAVEFKHCFGVPECKLLLLNRGAKVQFKAEKDKQWDAWEECNPTQMHLQIQRVKRKPCTDVQCQTIDK